MKNNWFIKNILFVCLGNICRSPMAEGWLKHYAENNDAPLNVRSAGIAACVGRPASQHAIDVMKENGIDISQHQPLQLTMEIAREEDLILVMEKWQQEKLRADFPFAYGKIHLIGKWDDFEIPDPYQHGKEDFENVFELIEAGLSAWINKMK
jgi:protein-tyrosine phosphatase